MSILQKIADIENEVGKITVFKQNIQFQMARTQKNKATNAHLGILKAKLAKLRRELITPKGGGGGAGEGFDVAKTGDARIGFVGRFSAHFSFFQRSKLRKFYSYIDICKHSLTIYSHSLWYRHICGWG